MFKNLIAKVNNSPNLSYRKKIRNRMIGWGIFGGLVGIAIAMVGLYILLAPLLSENPPSTLVLDIKSTICIFVFALGAFIFATFATLIIYALKTKIKY